MDGGEGGVDQAAEGERESRDRARYRSLVRACRDAIVQADPDGRIVDWNKGAERIFGYPRSEAVGRPVSTLMPERYREQHRRGLQRYLETGETSVIGETVELHGLRKDGTEFPIELSLDAFTVDGDRFFSGVVRDITGRKRAERELERRAEELAASNESWEEFGHVVSHDLKQPLRTIASHVQLIEKREGEDLDEETRSSIEFVTDAVHHMEDLLEGLLAYAEVETQGGTGGQADPNAVLAEVENHLEAQQNAFDAELAADEMPPVQVDPVQLRELLQNLVSNAFKHSGDDPFVRVYAEPGPEENVVLCVEDEGAGIPEDEQENVFAMFERGPGADETQGSGVGLAICRRIAERYGGAIDVVSEPGEGTTFRVELPRAD